MRTTKRSLVSSAVALLLCFSMLLGSTFAWFTDSAISGGNIVQSGSLDVEMYWSETLLAADSNEWKNADGVPVFTYDNWEPGYTDIKYVKIKNAGNLALQWRLSIAAEGKVSELADVIDVYYINPVSETVSTLDDKSSIGVLCDVINTHKYTSGILLPEGKTSAEYKVGETILAIAFHMQEEAGNEYKGKTIGDGFSLSLMATQFSWENDAFNKDYDKNPEWPNNVIVGGNSATADVVPDADNKVSGAVSLLSKDGKINASVPAGVMLGNGTNKLTLSVKDVANSKANITLDQTEAAMSIDVHIDGVAANNDVVMAIGIKELLPVGLNMGNYRFYHVENGATVEMQLLADGATPVHNNYEYDPSTGDVVLHLKSFSEVALVADTENAWEGAVDHSWYVDKSSPYTIANADQLWSFSQIVGGMAEDIKQDSFEGKTVKLIADINLGYGVENHPYTIFYPIGYYNSTGSYGKTSGGSVTSSVSSFEGTFDGNGNTIANFYQNTWEMFGDYNDGYSGTPNHYKDAMGLFGYVLNGTIKNLTVSNFSSDGEYTPTGVIAAYASNSTFENIAIKDCNPRVYNTGNGGIVGIGGNDSDPDTYKLTFTNITIDNSNKITALWGSWDVACGGLVGMFRGAGHAHMTNCHVGAQIDVYNDVCGNYQYYWYRYSGMMIGTNKNMITDKDGYTVPETSKFHAENCTVHFGDWNDYYYCELVANSLASYTHDHQFSRLTQIQNVSEIQDANGNWTTTGNFILMNGKTATETCYHIVKDANGNLYEHKHADAGEETVNGATVLKENNQRIFLPFNQLFTGYGWGVKHIPVYNGEEYAFDGIEILDRTEANSEDKFNVIINGESFETGTTLTLGEIFAAVEGAKINLQTLKVFVSPVGEDSTASAIYTPNTSDWTKGTLTFSGIGAAKIVITDYTYCKEAVTSVTITEPENTDKFIANGNLSYTHTLQGGTIEKTLGDIFSEVNGANIDYANIKVAYTITGDVTVEFVQNAENWAASTVKFTGAGSVTFTISDQNYCNDATATVSVGHPANEDKFTANGNLEYTPKHDKETYSFTFGQLFATGANEFVTDVVVTVNGVEHTFTKGEGWADKFVTLTEYGTYTVTITDNNYCNVVSATVTFNEPKTEAKFEYVGENVYYGGQNVTIGDLFAQIDNTEIGNDVVVTVNGETVYIGADWQNHELTFNKEGGFVIVIKEDSKYCNATTVTISIGKTDKLADKFTGDFLYRVGNANPVALGSLWAAKADIVVPVSGADVTIEPVKGNVSGAFTANASEWTKGTIQFTGTGVVKLTITADFANPVELMLEVVDAYNATSTVTAPYKYNNVNYSVVLLNDVTKGSFSVGGGYAFYGNGFTITLNPDSHTTKRGAGFDGYIHMTGGILDNVRIEGPVFAAANIYREQGQTGTGADDPVNYFRNAVIIDSGSNTISNSYISGARAAIYVKGGDEQVIENTTISGGAYANIEVAISNKVTFRNVTTEQIMQKDSYSQNKDMIGMGIVIDSEDTEVYIEGTLNQYNWITQAQWEAMLGSYVDQFPKLFTNNAYQKYWHYKDGDNTTKYVNVSIIFACAWDSGKLHDNRSDKTISYSPNNVTVAGMAGGVYSVTGAGTLTNTNMTAPAHNPTEQYPVAPNYDFNHKHESNYVPYTSGDNVFCYEENGIVKISFNEGENKIWNTSILSVSKLSEIIPYTVKMNGVDYTGKSITFSENGDYTVIYTYTDPYNYKLVDGQIVSYDKEYTKKVNITVSVVEEQAKNAEFTMGTTKNAVDKIIINNAVYLSAQGVDASKLTNTHTDGMKYSGNTTGSWASKTINGQTFYMPVVAMTTTDGTFKHTGSWYGCFPVFEGAITITDYVDGVEQVYNGSTKTMPSSLKALDPQSYFVYQGTKSKVPTEPSVPTKGGSKDKLCYTTQTDLSASNERGEMWSIATYTYVDNKGTTYYWYVAYYCAASTNGLCITPDTLITLADGTQVRVDSLTGNEELLVWNHETGKLDKAPVAYIVDHNGVVSEREIIHLNFANGKTVKIIGEHVFFDATLNKYVAVNTENVDSFIGHTFVALGSDGETVEKVELVSIEREITETTVYEVVSYKHLTCFTEGILSTSAYLDPLLNTFDIDSESLAYDAESVQNDIETYGLYTYADFEGLISEEAFELYNAAYLKIAIGKGYITWDDVLEMIDIYFNVGVTPLAE